MRTSLCSGRAKLMVLLLPPISAGCVEDQYEPARCSDLQATATPPDLPLAYETEHLDIYVDDKMVLCAGTANEYEQFYQYTKNELGIASEERVQVYMLESIDGYCRDGAAACRTQDGSVFTVPGATHHEIAHAASCGWRSSSAPALAEGLAVSFEVTPLTAKSDPFDFLTLENARDVYYDGAGHFVRWLMEEFEVSAFQEAYETAPRGGGMGVIDTLESAYAVTIDELVSMYESSAPYMWVPHRQCADLEHIAPVGGAWEFNSMFDCDDPSTFGPYERAGGNTNDDASAATSMYQSFLIEVEEPGLYVFERELETSVEIERCVEQTSLSEEEAAEQWHREGLLPTLQGTTEVELLAGTYRVDVLRQYAEPHPVWLRIEPDPG